MRKLHKQRCRTSHNTTTRRAEAAFVALGSRLNSVAATVVPIIAATGKRNSKGVLARGGLPPRANAKSLLRKFDNAVRRPRGQAKFFVDFQFSGSSSRPCRAHGAHDQRLARMWTTLMAPIRCGFVRS